MSALMYSNYVIAEVECRNLTAQVMVSRYRLLFDLKFDLTKWESGQLRGHVPYVTELRMTAKANGTLLGMALPTEDNFLPPIHPDTPGTVTVTRFFALDVDQQILEGIEQARMERDADFELEVFGVASILTLGEETAVETPFGRLAKTVSLLHEPRLSSASVHHKVSQSDWVELLDRMGYARTLLFEIPWPNGAEDKLPQAVSQFEAARAAFLSSSYAEAVGKLRDSLDTARKQLNILRPQWSQLSDRKYREGMDLNERFVLAWEATRHLTHPARHGDNYSRGEARYILGMGALALSLAATVPGVLQKTEEEA